MYKQEGLKIGQGQVGGASLELPAGSYRVVVEGSPTRTFSNVSIPGGEQVVLKLD